MISRRICQRNTWSSRGVCLWSRYCCLESSATASSSSTPTVSTPRTRFLGFSSQSCLPRRSSNSFYFANKFNNLNITFPTKECWLSTQAINDLQAGGIVDIPLAQTGEGIAECEMLRWFVQEGDQVEEFQPLCEVQSDKATIEITSRYKGSILQILHSPGDIVKVGETLLKMVVGDSLSPAQDSRTSDVMVPQSPDVSNLDNQTPVHENIKQVGVLSTPSVRNLAKQYGVCINDIAGTGMDGRVLKEDILNYAAVKGNSKGTVASSGSPLAEQLKDMEEEYKDAAASHKCAYEDKIIQLRGYRRAMVKSMNLAAKVPHFYYVEEINCDALVELKKSFQTENSEPSVKHTFLPFLIKSLSAVLSKYPFLNSCFNEELHEVTLKGLHNIGIAMATPHGLVVPNIKHVQSLSILEITKELSRLQQLALANRLGPDDISGGTITLSNIGAIGGKFGSPLINLPEVAIIAIGRIQKVPRFDDDGNVYAASIITVNVAADHRVLDGATVASFCNDWKLLIEKPEHLLLNMK